MIMGFGGMFPAKLKWCNLVHSGEYFVIIMTYSFEEMLA